MTVLMNFTVTANTRGNNLAIIPITKEGLGGASYHYKRDGALPSQLQIYEGNSYILTLGYAGDASDDLCSPESYINPLGKIANLPSGDSTEEMRREFEIDAKPYGFVLDRKYCATPEPWSEYTYTDTGHRWAGWQAAIASKQKELDQANATLAALRGKSIRGTNLMLEVRRLVNGEETLELFSDVEKIKHKLAALKAKIAEANKKAEAESDWYICSELPDGRLQYTQDNADEHAVQLFTRPPITSERELELLAVIEQMQGLLLFLRKKIIPDAPKIGHVTLNNATRQELSDWCKNVDKALALTPDMATLKKKY